MLELKIYIQRTVFFAKSTHKFRYVPPKHGSYPLILMYVHWKSIRGITWYIPNFVYLCTFLDTFCLAGTRCRIEHARGVPYIRSPSQTLLPRTDEINEVARACFFKYFSHKVKDTIIFTGNDFYFHHNNELELRWNFVWTCLV